jgi:hypothetical protein
MTELVGLAAFAATHDAAVRLVRRPGDDDDTAWSVEMTWGTEAPDSPMVGAAAYGMGSTPTNAIEQALAEAGVEPSGKPKALPRAELLELIDLLHALISADDSMEGHLQYEWGDEPGTYNVLAALRFGNRDGQGGVRLIGER